ncbi:predicted protein [Nematostella vectensis]|uniref:Fe2OG dioxygenase domain-containing protein n=1 Tax=Nematostella vectensis TaxID=45351 RepID=A7SXT6_NEMVE|nr:predicted protein [Nematostella vectensis]|eukprot:XP_001623582.1 predicted protein [Nematostella vectensis]
MAADCNRFVCRCFFTHNIFLEQYEAHVTFESEQQFTSQYRKAFYNRGCNTEEQWKSLLREVKEEVTRREKLVAESKRRKQQIAQAYSPLHPHLYNLEESFLSDTFLQVVRYAKRNDATAKELVSMLEVCQQGLEVYRLPVFTESFCEQFIEELEHFESSDVPRGRPNTMNNYGVLLSDLGFDEHFINPLRREYLQPITALLFPQWGGDGLDSHKAFTVHYMPGKDTELSYHYDNAEVTLSVCLGREFSGGDLYFGDMRQVLLEDTQCTEVENRPTYGLLHRGQHMHGALPTTQGSRYNLIIWMRASAVRNKLCPMCNRPPQLVQTEGEGDGFTSDAVVQLCATL